MPVQTQILTRRDTAANWTSTNPTLGSGEWGLETDTGLTKIGTGSTTWTNLNYFLPPFAGHAKMIPNQYYYPNWHQSTGTNSTGVGYFYATPIIIPNTITVTSINFEVVTSSSAGAGGAAKVGIYSSDSNNQPNSLIIESASVSTETAGIKEITMSQSLKAGVYWLALAWQVNVTGLTYRYVTSVAPYVSKSSNFSSTSVFSNCYLQTGVTSSMPATYSSTNCQVGAPKMWIKT